VNDVSSAGPRPKAVVIASDSAISRRLLRVAAEEVEILGIIREHRRRSRTAKIRYWLRRGRRRGWRQALDEILLWLLDRPRRTPSRSGGEAFGPVIVVSDVNGPEVHDYLVASRPDLLIVYAARKLKSSLFADLQLGGINIHHGFLRGYGNWAALRQERHDMIGITVHFLSPELDDGEIIVRCPIDFLPGDGSLAEFLRRESDTAVEALRRALQLLKRGDRSRSFSWPADKTLYPPAGYMTRKRIRHRLDAMKRRSSSGPINIPPANIRARYLGLHLAVIGGVEASKAETVGRSRLSSWMKQGGDISPDDAANELNDRLQLLATEEVSLDALADALWLAASPGVLTKSDRPLIGQRLLSLADQLDPTAVHRRWPGGKSMAVVLTHDLDILQFVHIRNALAYARRGLRRPGQWRFMASQLLRLLLGGVKGYDFFCYLKMEERRQKKSTLFVQARPDDSRCHVNDALYHLDEPITSAGGHTLSDLLMMAIEAGHEIGLHTSIAAANEDSDSSEEKRRLEEVTGRAVTSSRPHYLRSPWHSGLPSRSSLGLAVSSSLGFGDWNGFVNGLGIPCVPTDAFFEDEWHVEMPITWMDTAFLKIAARRGQPRPPLSEYVRRFTEDLDIIQAMSGFGLIDWHFETASTEQFADCAVAYESFLGMLEARDAWAGTCSDMERHLKQRWEQWRQTSSDISSA
jgi:hypothetical protein